MGSLVLNPDLQETLLVYTDTFFEDQLGPDIAGDAKEYCPVSGPVDVEIYRRGDSTTQISRTVEDPGALRDSIEYHLNVHTLIVAATGTEQRWYAAFVELGHRVFHPSTHIVGPESVAPEPFLRPALYQVRSY